MTIRDAHARAEIIVYCADGLHDCHAVGVEHCHGCSAIKMAIATALMEFYKAGQVHRDRERHQDRARKAGSSV